MLDSNNCDTPDSPPVLALLGYITPSTFDLTPHRPHRENASATPPLRCHLESATMKRNLVIFVIIISLFSVIAIIGYLIYRLQSRVGFARPTASESEQSEA
ncbi:uncharacterized protein J3D65DRAFT_669118 [Phyllosticta citribraziliensis]|uniref:Uncharacterized protein n=1 Tax=Phyllosticta citribraziliensis TaxID=989973 RepID=A0ABR1LIH2_9PEZI